MRNCSINCSETSCCCKAPQAALSLDLSLPRRGELKSTAKRSVLRGDRFVPHNLRICDQLSIMMLNKEEAYLCFGIPATERHEMGERHVSK